MAQTTFSGPVKSDNGFLAPSYTLVQAAAIDSPATGLVIYISDATGASVTGSLCFYNGTSFIDVTTGIAAV
jgi:hypothetical protein